MKSHDRDSRFAISKVFVRPASQATVTIARIAHSNNPIPKQPTDSYQPEHPQTFAEMKARQSAKIKEIADALLSSGFLTLDAQARALGLCRSTTWTLLKSNHKSTGISAKIINRILAAPQLPPVVRAKTLEYVDEKVAGCYGHCKKTRCKFVTSINRLEKHRIQEKMKIVRIAAGLDLEQRPLR